MTFFGFLGAAFFFAAVFFREEVFSAAASSPVDAGFWALRFTDRLTGLLGSPTTPFGRPGLLVGAGWSSRRGAWLNVRIQSSNGCDCGATGRARRAWRKAVTGRRSILRIVIGLLTCPFYVPEWSWRCCRYAMVVPAQETRGMVVACCCTARVRLGFREAGTACAAG